MPQTIGRRRRPICPYCGENPGTTTDHVIPKGLFPKPLPNNINLPTVKACKSCNNERKSRDDSFLRDFLICDPACELHPSASSLFGGEFTRSMREGKSEVATHVRKHARPIPRLTSSGLYVGTAMSATFDLARVNGIFTNIVRGLYYKKTAELLPRDTRFTVLRQRARDVSTFTERVAPAATWYRSPKLMDVFQCIYALGRPTSVWLLQFFEGIYFSVVTDTEPTEDANPR